MHVLEATFTLVTPLLLGGSSLRNAEIAPSMVKTSLRYWWRVLSWNDPRYSRSVRQIRDAEQRLFGPSDTENSPFFLSVQHTPLRTLQPGTELPVSPGDAVGQGLAYVGHGALELISMSDEDNATGRASGGAPGEEASGGDEPVRLRVLRPCVLPPLQLTLTLAFQEPPDPSLISAIEAMGLLGGIGARTRRGFGNLSLNTLHARERLSTQKRELFRAPTTADGYAQMLQRLFKSDVRLLPPFPAITAHTRVVQLLEGTSSLKLLEVLGIRLERFRLRLKKEEERRGVLEYLNPRPHYLFGEHGAPRQGASREGMRAGSRVDARPSTDASPRSARNEAQSPWESNRAAEFRREARPSERHAPMETKSNDNRLSDDRGAEARMGDARGLGGNEPDHRVGALFFHIHRLNPHQVAAMVAIFPAVEEPPEERQNSSFQPRGRSRQAPLNLDALALDEFLRGYFHHTHAQFGQQYFPDATILVPEHRPVRQERSSR